VDRGWGDERQLRKIGDGGDGEIEDEHPPRQAPGRRLGVPEPYDPSSNSELDRNAGGELVAGIYPSVPTAVRKRSRSPRSFRRVFS